MEQATEHLGTWRQPKVVLSTLALLLVAGIVVVSLVRDRIVNQPQWQVTVVGQGRVAYQPDQALVTLGVHVDKQRGAEAALKQLNEKVGKVVAAIKAADVQAEDVQTQAYTLYPQYDYKDGASLPSGYSANQQLVVKVRNLGQGSEQLTRVVAEATKAGANQVLGITFDVFNLNELKQQARLEAIADARSKAGALAAAAGVRLGKVIGWWEVVVQAPGLNSSVGMGMGGADKGSAAPTLPNGSQEVVVEMNLSYRVK